MIRIVLDAMGSDGHPQPEIEAAVAAARRWPEAIHLAGPAEPLTAALGRHGLPPDRIVVHDAPEVLEMTDKGARAARGKAVSSMAVGIDLVRNGEVDAFVTAGNTGGAMATALLRLGRLKGVKRPALAPTFPVAGGRAVVLDIGANVDCRPEYLAQFAVMGSVYAQVTLGLNRPRVGLLSNGEEAGKGSALTQEAYPLLQACGVHFVGNIEPKEVYAGSVDVAVTDGFNGNIFLKTSEAVAGFLVAQIRKEIGAGPLTIVGGLLARPAFRRIRRLLDPAEYGAVPLLGVNGLVFIGHGRSEARALVQAVAAARQAVAGGLLEALRLSLRTRLQIAGAPETGEDG